MIDQRHQERISNNLGTEAYWAMIHQEISISEAMKIQEGRRAMEDKWNKLEIAASHRWTNPSSSMRLDSSRTQSKRNEKR